MIKQPMQPYAATFEEKGDPEIFVSVFYATSEDKARDDAQIWASGCEDIKLISIKPKS